MLCCLIALKYLSPQDRLSIIILVQAPTFLDLAGVPVPDSMDGQSLKEPLMGKTPEVCIVHECVREVCSIIISLLNLTGKLPVCC